MTGSRKRLRTLAFPDDAPYEVGYGKPPVATRFKPGRSGNPAGRPKGARNKRPAHEERLKKIVLAEAYRKIDVQDGSVQVTVPMAQAVIRAVAVSAAKGNHRSQRLFTELVSETESGNRKLQDELLKTALYYKECWEEVIESARRRGLPEPDPIPHPRDIVIDLSTGKVEIQGPMTKEQRAAGHALIRKMKEKQEEIEVMKADRATIRKAGTRAFLYQEIASQEALMARLVDMIMPVDWLRKAWIEEIWRARS